MHAAAALGFDFKLYIIYTQYYNTPHKLYLIQKRGTTLLFIRGLLSGLGAYILMYCCTYNNPISNEWSMHLYNTQTHETYIYIYILYIVKLNVLYRGSAKSGSAPYYI